mgnify:CR=1 FL=1
MSKGIGLLGMLGLLLGMLGLLLSNTLVSVTSVTYATKQYALNKE